MKNPIDLFFYNETLDFIDLNYYECAIKSIKNNIENLRAKDDIAIAYLNCGFLSNKLGDYLSAIDYFSKTIKIEDELEIINQISKDVSLNGRSDSRYQVGDYKGAIEDKRNAKKIRLLENFRSNDIKNIKIDYKNILLGTFSNIELEPQYRTLIKVSKVEKSKYDLIEDYKKVISYKRKEEVIKKLESLSDSKYKSGEYKASIRAIRRSEKYY